jgi:hypothetical protein
MFGFVGNEDVEEVSRSDDIRALLTDTPLPPAPPPPGKSGV